MINLKKLLTKILACFVNCEQHVLIWENTATTTATGATTIALSSLNADPRDFDYIEVYFRYSTSSTGITSFVNIPTNVTSSDYGGTPAFVYTNIWNSSDPKANYRAMRCQTDGSLYFTTGYYKTTFNTSTRSTSTSIMIPYKVYGVRKHG